MAVEFQKTTIVFNPVGRERAQPDMRLSGSETVRFTRPVASAEVALQGFRARFDNGDHHVLEQEVIVNVAQIAGTTVTVNATLALRDAGGFDDPFSGFVQVLVIAETVDG